MNRLRVFWAAATPSQRRRLVITAGVLVVIVALLLSLAFCGRSGKKASKPLAAPRSSAVPTPPVPPAPPPISPPAAPVSPAPTDASAKPSPFTKTAATSVGGSRLETLINGLADKVERLVGQVSDLGKRQKAVAGKINSLSSKVERVEGRLDNIEKRAPPQTPLAAVGSPPTPTAEPPVPSTPRRQLSDKERADKFWREHLSQPDP